jgi:SAM-dependent methyltransferase
VAPREAGRVPIDPVAAGGFSSAAATYARIRPAYARAAIGALRDDVPGGELVDVAAGTGILTGQLVRAGLRAVAVEPLDAMARQLRLSLPAVPVALGVAEELPLAAGVADLLTVAQGFHWFDHGPALAEAARVLRPGGELALLWNVRDESVPWVHELTELVEHRTGGRPYDDHREHRWEDVIAASGRFGEVTLDRYPNPVATTVGGVLDRLRSTSFVADLDDGPRAALLDEAAALLAGHPELTGTFDYPHDTLLYRCRRPR